MFQFLRSNASIPLIIMLVIWGISTFLFVQAEIAPFYWELKNQLIGQKLNEGFRMYQDIRDNTGPFAAGFFQLLDFLRIPISMNAYWASALIIFQGFVFQRTIQRYELMPPMGYLPFFIYAVFFHFSLDFIVPSAALLGVTFLLLAWREIVKQQSTLNVDDRVFLIGLFIGAAGLCYPSYFLFIFWAFLSLVFYSGINIRQLLLVLVGFLIVNIITGLVYTYHGNFPYLIQVFQNSAIEFHAPVWAQLQDIAWAYLAPIAFAIYGFWKVVENPKVKSNGQKAQQTNLIWIFTGIIAIFTLPATESNNVLFFLPALAYFSLNSFFLLKKYWIREMMIWGMLGLSYFSLALDWKTQSQKRIQESSLPIRNEKIMILGPQIEAYRNNTMAGPFVNWELSKSLFDNLNQYKTIVLLDQYMNQDAPNYIYDPTGKFKLVQNYLPYLKTRYQETGNHLYKRVN
ncbi:MAG: hypothetical protein RIQ98_1066 [Bacteroidota bacterium]